MKTNPNESAMPLQQTNHESIGLTKREHFAAMAMQGMCANPHIGDEKPEDIARFAVEQADAFIEALNKEKP